MNRNDTAAKVRPSTNGPIHRMFGLTYASHEVLNRTLLQDMPIEWQRRYVALRRELGAAHADAGAVEYQVLTGQWWYPDELEPRSRRQRGITHRVADGACGRTHAVGDDCQDDCDPDGNLDWVYLDKRGREVHGSAVFVPTADPIPHYRHGYVPPDLSAPWSRVHQAEQVRLLLGIHGIEAETEPAAQAGEWLPNRVIVSPVVELAPTTASEWSRDVTRAVTSVRDWAVQSVATRLTDKAFGAGVLVQLPAACP